MADPKSRGPQKARFRGVWRDFLLVPFGTMFWPKCDMWMWIWRNLGGPVFVMVFSAIVRSQAPKMGRFWEARHARSVVNSVRIWYFTFWRQVASKTPFLTPPGSLWDPFWRYFGNLGHHCGDFGGSGTQQKKHQISRTPRVTPSNHFGFPQGGV